MTKVIKDIDEMKSLIGTEHGVSHWPQSDQAQIKLYDDTTADPQGIHVPDDKDKGLLSATIAHGIMTMTPQARLTG